MANTASAKKRIRQNEKRRLRNRRVQGHARATVKKAHTAIEAGNFEEAEEFIRQAAKALDKAVNKNIIHKNKAARTKSRLMTGLNEARREASA